MTNTSTNTSGNRRLVGRRRLVLLASAAGLSTVVALGGYVGHGGAPLPAWMPSAQAAEGQQQAPGFADLVAKVKPAVISVRVQMDEDIGAPGTQGSNDDNEQAVPPFMQNSPFEKFFRQYGDTDTPNGRSGTMPRRHQAITGEGSGFFISADGYAVTNNHVVDHAKSVQVTTDDGATYTAKVIGTDAKTDLALIKVDGKTNFAYVNFEDHPSRIGDWVVAVGNPFGLGGTVTAGIISAHGRDIGAGPYDDYIQIDAPINKGNSGGPAFDLSGNVIGVNTAIYSPSGGSVGIGFDIPAETAKMVIAQLKDKGAVTRGWLGVQVQPVTKAIADSLGMKTAGGAMVDEPQPGSPAARAGIESGDVITALDGTPVRDSRDLARRVAMLAPGSSAKLDVFRKGETKSMTITLAEMPNQHQANAADRQSGSADSWPHLGLTVAPANDVAGSGGKGLVVTSVDPEGTAAAQGLQSGDIILDVGSRTVTRASDLRAALSEAKAQGKHGVLMRVKSADTTRFVALPIG
jgi:serine protease Do